MNELILTLLIPTYNEEDIIENTLKQISLDIGELLSKKTEIIVVDDGSDNLVDIVSRSQHSKNFANVSVIRSTPPVGKGASIAKGIKKANASIVGFLDVDLSTPATYIPIALEHIQKNACDVFIGSRRTKEAQVDRDQIWIKDLLGYGLGVVARNFIFFGMKNYKDTQCGFKFFKKNIALELYKDLISNDGLTDLEILMKANLNGVRVMEYGVIWKDLRESKRALSRIFWGDFKSFFKIVMRYRLKALLPRGVKWKDQ